MDVIDRAQSALSNNSIHALRELRVRRDGDCLILSGRVNSYYHKQMAQEVVRIIAQDMHVVNAIDVCYSGDPDFS